MDFIDERYGVPVTELLYSNATMSNCSVLDMSLSLDTEYVFESSALWTVSPFSLLA
jgi:hypothetical protein